MKNVEKDNKNAIKRIDDECHDVYGTVTETTIREHYVSDCPYRKADIPAPCDKIPENFICSTDDCRAIGERLAVFDWVHTNRVKTDDIIRALALADTETVNRLIDAYLETPPHTL